MAAHIELYDEDLLDAEDEDLFTFNKKPAAWEERRSGEEGEDSEKSMRHPPPARSAYSAAPTDDEDWLAPDTPSPYKGGEEDDEDVFEGIAAVDGDGLNDLLDMAEEAEEQEEEAGGGRLPSELNERGKQAWGEGSSGDNTNGGGSATTSTASRNTTNTNAAAAAAAPPRAPVDRRRPAVAETPTQLAVNDWLSDGTVLRNKQKIIEARDARLAPEIEVVATHGGAAATVEQDDLRKVGRCTSRMR
jgi:hypothetical protein